MKATKIGSKNALNNFEVQTRKYSYKGCPESYSIDCKVEAVRFKRETKEK